MARKSATPKTFSDKAASALAKKASRARAAMPPAVDAWSNNASEQSARQSPESSATGSEPAKATQRTVVAAFFTAVAMWSAFAPLNLWWMAWLAPIGCLTLIERQEPIGKLGYWILWLAGSLFWLLILHGIRLAFWPLIFGWLILSLYLAVYLPLFVATARWMRWRWQVPLVLAGPIAWVGLEFIRGYLFTGYAANTLAHSQVKMPTIIQLADQLGSGGISFVMVAVASCLAVMGVALRNGLPSLQLIIGSWLVAAVGLAGLLGYGVWKLGESDALEQMQISAGEGPLLRALLVQENTPTVFENNPERSQLAWTRYMNMTREGIRKLGPANLVVWPESTFTANEPIMEAELGNGLPAELLAAGFDRPAFEQRLEAMRQVVDFKIGSLLMASLGDSADASISEVLESGRGAHCLVGNDLLTYTSDGYEVRNAAIFITPDGRIADRYSKMHLVLVGEAMPLEPMLGWLSRFFGHRSIQAGREAKSFIVKPNNQEETVVRVAPSICFESMVPHLISRQVRELAARGEAPDVLVNISNDSWFRGSSALDHHLASSILTAVENRRPMLVAANTGLSAEISGSGQLKQVSERLAAATILAEPRRDNRPGLVQAMGYPVSWLWAMLTGAVMAHALADRWIASKTRPTQTQ